MGITLEEENQQQRCIDGMKQERELMRCHGCRNLMGHLIDSTQTIFRQSDEIHMLRKQMEKMSEVLASQAMMQPPAPIIIEDPLTKKEAEPR